MFFKFSKLFFIFFTNCKISYLNLIIFFFKDINLILKKDNNISFYKLNNKYRLILFKISLIFFKKKINIESFSGNWRFKYLNFYKLDFKYNFSSYIKFINKNNIVNEKNSSILNIYDFYDLLFYKQSSLNKIILTKRVNILRKLLLGNSYFSKKVYRLRKSFIKIKNINKKIRNFNFYFYKTLILLKGQKIQNKFNIENRTLSINFIIKKNNSFLILSDNFGQVIYFISAGRIAKGKKKRSPVTIKTLSRVFTKFIFRYLKHEFFKFKLLNPLNKLNVYISFRITRLLNNYLIKTILFNFKSLHLPIHFLIDSIKLPHSLGVKKKKLRRV